MTSSSRRESPVPTERVNPRTVDLDLLDDGALFDLLVTEQRRALEAVRRVAVAQGELVGATAERLRRGGRLVYVAAGTSGLLAEADLAEIPATFGFDAARLCILRPSVGAGEDDGSAGAAAVKALAPTSDDTVVGLAASGATPWVVHGLRDAAASGATTIAVANNPDSAVAREARHEVHLATGPEPVTGSTRMSAGLAQKLWLTSFSTAVMVRLGCTFGNLMSRATGGLDKLHRRRIRIVSTATGLAESDAESLLHEAGGVVEVAILLHLGANDADDAAARLAAAGSLRAALAVP